MKRSERERERERGREGERERGREGGSIASWSILGQGDSVCVCVRERGWRQRRTAHSQEPTVGVFDRKKALKSESLARTDCALILNICLVKLLHLKS